MPQHNIAGSSEEVRLSKYISLKHGISRKKAEGLITKHGLEVEYKPTKNPSLIVSAHNAKITIPSSWNLSPSGHIQAAGDEIYALHKPDGYIVTRSEKPDAKTVYDLLPPNLSNFIYIGRLDVISEGLLLFTNNGQLAQFFERPQNEIEREYHVKVRGTLDQKKLQRIKMGTYIEGVSHRPKYVEKLPHKGGSSSHWISITLTSGKNREVRKLLSFFGLGIVRLIRVRYGPIQLGKLQKGQLAKIPWSKATKGIKKDVLAGFLNVSSSQNGLTPPTKHTDKNS